MFTKVYETRYGDYKDFNNIKVSSLLDIAQDIAVRHSEHCGYGMQKLREMNLAWLVQGIKLHIEKMPEIDCDITAKTAIKNMKATLSERGCILSQNCQTVAKIVTNWFLFDTQRMRPTRILPEIADSYSCYNFDDDFFNYEKPSLYEAEGLYKIRVSNKEIDTNCHLNNQKGAELLMDVLPFDFQFTDMNILYKKASYLGDELELCLKRIENGYYAHLQTEDNMICVAGTFQNNKP